MALEKFTRYQKIILIALAAALVLPLGIAGVLTNVMSEHNKPLFVLFGRKVREADFQRFARRWETIGRANPLAARQMDLDQPDSMERYFLMTAVAQETGVRASDESVTAACLALLNLDSNTKRKYYEDEVLRKCGQPVNVFEQAVRELIMCRSLRGLLQESIKVSTAELKAFFEKHFSEVKVEVAALRSELWRSDVLAPTEEDLRQRYETDKETPWLMIPRRVKVEYLAAPYETWMPLVSVAEEDLHAYYERKKADYLIEEPPASQPSAETRPASESRPAAGGGAPETQPASPAQESATIQVAPTPEPAPTTRPRYRSFEEVRDEIEKTIRARRAKEDVGALIMKARREAHELGMDEAAKRNGLLPGTTDFFSEDEAAEVPVLGGATSGTDDETSLRARAFRLEVGDTSTCANPDGEYVIRLAEDHPSRAPSFEEARSTVLERMLAEKTFDAALAAARKSLDAAAGGASFSDAIALVGKPIDVTSTDYLSAFSPEPYARDAVAALPGKMNVTTAQGESPVIYLWTVIERKLPEDSVFQNFKRYFGNAQFLQARYPDLEDRLLAEMRAFAGWQDMRSKTETPSTRQDADEGDLP
ncbi:MAG: hypothetical protein V2A58_00350 [Planctomycetota bacterium]